MFGRAQFFMMAGALALAMASAQGAHDDESPKAVPEALAHAPSAVPDRTVLTWAGDPARSVAATWRTDASVPKGLAQIAPAGPSPSFVEAAKTVTAQSQDLTTDLGTARYHSVKFEGLEPATKYAYRVGDGANWSEWHQFTTTSAGPAPLTFVYFGDAQNDIKSLWSRVIREAHADAPRAHFLLHAGDLVNHANADAEWGEWHGAGGWLNAMVPNFPTPGNHEYANKGLSAHWRPQFTLPENGAPGLEEACYFVDVQGVRIVSLDSNVKLAEQAKWLDETLAKGPQRWTVLTFHHPVFSSAKGRDNKAVRELWQPIIDKHKVDLVLTGHDHTYARTGLERAEAPAVVASAESAPGTEVNVPTGVVARDERSGTVYVVSVSGPKMYVLEREPRMRRAASDTQLYQVIKIDGPLLTFEARDATGALYDGFELRKSQGAPNELIERRPERAERVEPPKSRVPVAPVPAPAPVKGPGAK